MTYENLNGKVIVITGGSGVLCTELAIAAGQQKMKVVLIGRTMEKLEKTAELVKQVGGDAMCVQCDVTDKAALEEAKIMINSAWGEVNILVNGAGGNHPTANTTIEGHADEKTTDDITFFDLDPENVRNVFDINFMGTFIPSQVFGEDMVGKSGTIINISSMSAYHPMTKVSAYSAAKAAVSNFTEWLAVHFAKSGIRVNAIAPGFFETKQNKTLLRTPEGELTPRSEKILRGTPMGRFGVPSDLSGTFLWLCDETLSGFVTGIVVPVDGGFNAYSGV